jgi:hypothetical protein
MASAKEYKEYPEQAVDGLLEELGTKTGFTGTEAPMVGRVFQRAGEVLRRKEARRDKKVILSELTTQLQLYLTQDGQPFHPEHHTVTVGADKTTGTITVTVFADNDPVAVVSAKPKETNAVNIGGSLQKKYTEHQQALLQDARITALSKKLTQEHSTDISVQLDADSKGRFINFVRTDGEPAVVVQVDTAQLKDFFARGTGLLGIQKSSPALVRKVDPSVKAGEQLTAMLRSTYKQDGEPVISDDQSVVLTLLGDQGATGPNTPIQYYIEVVNATPYSQASATPLTPLDLANLDRVADHPIAVRRRRIDLTPSKVDHTHELLLAVPIILATSATPSRLTKNVTPETLALRLNTALGIHADVTFVVKSLPSTGDDGTIFHVTTADKGVATGKAQKNALPAPIKLSAPEALFLASHPNDRQITAFIKAHLGGISSDRQSHSFRISHAIAKEERLAGATIVHGDAATVARGAMAAAAAAARTTSAASTTSDETEEEQWSPEPGEPLVEGEEALPAADAPTAGAVEEGEEAPSAGGRQGATAKRTPPPIARKPTARPSQSVTDSYTSGPLSPQGSQTPGAS